MRRTDGMNELVEWLRAQLDEDERVAREATCEPWHMTTKSDRPYMQDGEIHTVAVHARWVGDKNPEPYQVVTHGDFHEAVDRADAEHIALHDPDRVLREVEAKRRMVDLAEYMLGFDSPDGDLGRQPLVATGGREMLRLLTPTYSDRPGYRSEWAPSDA